MKIERFEILLATKESKRDEILSAIRKAAGLHNMEVNIHTGELHPTDDQYNDGYVDEVIADAIDIMAEGDVWEEGEYIPQIR